jgi:hypothetical protein
MGFSVFLKSRNLFVILYKPELDSLTNLVTHFTEFNQFFFR